VAGRQEVGFASGCAVKASQYSSSCQAVSPEYSLAHVSVETLFGAGRTVIGIFCGFLFSSWIGDSSRLIFSRCKPIYGITVNISSYRASIRTGIKTKVYVES
jgi:hypothetical protein